MGIYTGNSYNAMGAIQAALNNIAERNRIKREYWKTKGDVWSNFANQMGKMGGRIVDAYSAGSEGYDANSPEARLAALQKELEEAKEAERIQAIETKYNEQVAQRQAMDEYLKNAAQQQNIPVEPSVWNGYDNVDLDENLYRKAINGGLYA